MSSSRREFLGQVSAITVSSVVAAGLGLGTGSGCATQWEFVLPEDSDHCSVLQATKEHFGEEGVVTRRHRGLNAEQIVELGGYYPEPGKGWTFRVDGALLTGSGISAGNVVVQPGSTVEWVVAS